MTEPIDVVTELKLTGADLAEACLLAESYSRFVSHDPNTQQANRVVALAALFIFTHNFGKQLGASLPMQHAILENLADKVKARDESEH